MAMPDFSGLFKDSSGGGGGFDFSRFFGGEGPPQFGGGSNQFMRFPSMTPSATAQDTSVSPPGIVPPAGAPPGFSAFGQASGPPELSAQKGGVGAATKLPGGAGGGPTLDPRFTQAFDQFLRSFLGRGATPFNLSALLPSTGEATTPGTLTAPMNPIMESLMKFFQTGEGGPMPGVLPMWEAAMGAMRRPEEEAEANLREQFSFMGNLASSPFGTSMADFQNQAALSKQALLGQLSLQALPQMMGFGGELQGLDQSSIDRMIQEFIRTRPEYSPLLGAQFGMATTFPPIYTKQGGVGQALIGSAGDIMGGLAALLPMLGLCWVARAIYGDESREARVIRFSLPILAERSFAYRIFLGLYIIFGQPVGWATRRVGLLRRMLKPIFDKVLRRSELLLCQLQHNL